MQLKTICIHPSFFLSVSHQPLATLTYLQMHGYSTHVLLMKSKMLAPRRPSKNHASWSRLIMIQQRTFVLTQSPTIQRVSQRLIICLAAVLPNTKLYLRDVTQAYVQSNISLNRESYIRPPHELATLLGPPKDCILKVLKPLYGVPEAGNHWFETYNLA